MVAGAPPFTPPPTRRRGRGGAILLAALLIGLGLWSLLENLGLVPGGLLASFWPALGSFWPLLIVLAGLELLVRRRAGVGWLVVGIALIAVLGVFTVAPTGRTVAQTPPRGGTAEVQRVTVPPLPSPASRETALSIDQPVGSLQVRAGAPSAALAEVEARFPPDVRLEVTGAGTDRVAIKSEWPRGPGFRFPGFGRGGSPSELQVALAPDQPLNLSVHTGAGESDLDLRNLALHRLQLEAGVGQTTLRLPSRGTVEARVGGGVGSLVIEVPDGVAARIRVESGVASREIDQQSFPRVSDDTFQSPDWATAPNRVDLRIEVGVGNLTVRRAAAGPAPTPAATPRTISF